jgi:hypothetical protein
MHLAKFKVQGEHIRGPGVIKFHQYKLEYRCKHSQYISTNLTNPPPPLVLTIEAPEYHCMWCGINASNSRRPNYGDIIIGPRELVWLGQLLGFMNRTLAGS